MTVLCWIGFFAVFSLFSLVKDNECILKIIVDSVAGVSSVCNTMGSLYSQPLQLILSALTPLRTDGSRWHTDLIPGCPAAGLTACYQRAVTLCGTLTPLPYLTPKI